MGTTSEPASDQPDERGTLRRAVGGDQAAWAQVLAPHRKRLRRMVALRLDQRLRGRIDPSDVLQEAFLQAANALPKYLERPEQPVFLWLRWLTGMTLQHLHRRHLGVQAREAGREVQLLDRPWPEATSALVNSSKCRRTRTSRSTGSMALRASCSRRCRSARIAATLGRAFEVDRHWAHRLVRAEVDLDAGMIRFHRLRRREPGDQPLLKAVVHRIQPKPFHE